MEVVKKILKNKYSQVVMLLLYCLCTARNVDAQGMNFCTGCLDMAMREARKQHKLLLVDCYTSWCGPCHQMAEKVFPDPVAGKYFNAKFVCWQVDMETAAGINIHDTYGIYCYPTVLLLHPDGREINRVVGASLQAIDFIARVEKALLPQYSRPALREYYRQNPSFEEEYFSYLEENCLQREFASVLADRFFKQTNAERFSTKDWALYKYNIFDVTSPVMQFVAENADIVAEYLGKSKAEAFIYEGVLASLRAMLVNGANNQEGINRMDWLFQHYHMLQKPYLLTWYQLVKAKETGEYDTFIRIYEEEVVHLNYLRRKELDKGLIRLKHCFPVNQQERILRYFQNCRERDSSDFSKAYYKEILEKW